MYTKTALLFVLLAGCAKPQSDSKSPQPAHDDPPPAYDTIDVQPTSSEKKYSTYIVYHFGAKWCGPCQTMKREVWTNEEVIKSLKDLDIKSIGLDANKKEHKKYFRYYKVRSYPTVILFNRKDLKKHIARGSFMRKPAFLKFIRDNLSKTQ